MEWQCADTFGVTILGMHVSTRRRATTSLISRIALNNHPAKAWAFDAPSLNTTAKKWDVEDPGQFLCTSTMTHNSDNYKHEYLEQGFWSVKTPCQIIGRYLPVSTRYPITDFAKLQLYAFYKLPVGICTRKGDKYTARRQKVQCWRLLYVTVSTVSSSESRRLPRLFRFLSFSPPTPPS